ncbi:MAG: PPC domain-containing protein, partial [Planctomycetota bacterium]|nr:PPC domain-containing protein [Planctomycetota bacterium]
MRLSLRARVGLFLPAFALGFCVISSAVQAQPAIPAISSTSPQAAPPGQTIDVKIRGGNLAGPTQLWTGFPAEVTLPTDLAGNGTNAAEVTYRLKLPADAAVGIYGVRVATPQGISNLKLFAVDDLPSVAQVRPNQVLANAQAITIPAAVDGYVDNLSRDYYKFTGAAGQKISIEVLARRLGSPLDSMVRLLDAKGRELAYSDDALGLGSDSMISYTLKEAGDYIVEVRDIRFQGGGNFLYRLRIGDFPCVTVPYPMGVQRGAPAQVTFAGKSVDGVQPVPVALPADSPFAYLPLGAKANGAKSSGFGVVSVGSTPEAMEVEPNNEQAQATRVPVEASLNGRFDAPGDIDRFIFTAKAGTRYVFTAVTRQAGSPCDLFLRLLKTDGAEVASADDVGTADGIIDYTFPADGDYTLVVEDLHRRGGTEFAYRIAVAPFSEKFELSATADTLNIPAGGLASITINAVRGSFGGPIELSLVDAPEGVVATPTVIGPGLATTVLTVVAAPNVAPGK